MSHHVKAFLQTPKAIMERERRQSRWHFIKHYLWMIGCQDCGEPDPNVLDFHHVRGKKKFNIARAVSAGFALRTIIKEIGKCRVVCANCHRRHTGKSQGWARFLPNVPQGVVAISAE